MVVTTASQAEEDDDDVVVEAVAVAAAAVEGVVLKVDDNAEYDDHDGRAPRYPRHNTCCCDCGRSWRRSIRCTNVHTTWSTSDDKDSPRCAVWGANARHRTTASDLDLFLLVQVLLSLMFSWCFL